MSMYRHVLTGFVVGLDLLCHLQALNAASASGDGDGADCMGNFVMSTLTDDISGEWGPQVEAGIPDNPTGKYRQSAIACVHTDLV